MNSDQESPKISAELEIQQAPILAKVSAGPENSEEKLLHILGQMKSSIEKSSSSGFKHFWDLKKEALSFFKNSHLSDTRRDLWLKYTEISNEAKHVKQVLDKESAFAAEQIDLALSSLEKEIERYDETLLSLAPLKIPEAQFFSSEKEAFYNENQNELSFLATFVARINGLRKEVIRTEMRIRTKNQLFDRLSKAGDRIFPRRKELIKTLSEAFSKDIAHFIQRHFKEEALISRQIFEVREQIKSLQSLARHLTLDSKTFNETRLALSKSWDVIKETEKDRKKEQVEQKNLYKQNVESILARIQPLAEKASLLEITLEELEKQIAPIAAEMRSLTLGRYEVAQLKEALAKAKAPLLEKLKQAEEERQKQQDALKLQRKAKIDLVKTDIETFLENSSNVPVEEMNLAKEEFSKKITSLQLSLLEKDTFDVLLKKIRDSIIDKKEQALLLLSSEELHSFESLKQALAERKSQRADIKNLLESYRKAPVSSGLDFEKAQAFKDLVNSEKMRLQKVEAAIDDIEEKLSEYE